MPMSLSICTVASTILTINLDTISIARIVPKRKTVFFMLTDYAATKFRLPFWKNLPYKEFGYLLTIIVAIGPAIAAIIAIIAMIIMAILNRLLRFSSSLASSFALTCASYISLSFA